MSFASAVDGSRIYYEQYGTGPGIILGHALFATTSPRELIDAYLERLTDRYSVVTFDYPGGTGRSDPVAPGTTTADRVCDDIGRVADAAGFDTFCWWGFSWGGGVGVQLASRTDRIAALVCGAYPPLGGFHLWMVEQDVYAKGLPVGRGEERRRIPPSDTHGTYFRSLADWPEREAVESISCPRLCFVGSEDEFTPTFMFAEIIHDRREELQRMGWQVVEVPDKTHALYTEADVVVPLVREFLDPLPRWR